MNMYSSFTPKIEDTPAKAKKVSPAKEIETIKGLPKTVPVKWAKPNKITKASGKMKIKSKAKKPSHEFFVS